MGRVLVTEKLAESGIELLRSAGHDVAIETDLDETGLRTQIATADALIVRSATQVTPEVLDAARVLKVIGRAGVGLDNIDTVAATARGVIVANAPTSNSISAAEHAVALLLALARNVPQAHAALSEGRWERARWKGIELNDKVLGIVGLGRIGGLVATRARAFGMHLVGHDPFVSEERADELGVELLELDDLMARSDFVTLHLAKTPDTIDLIDAERLAHAKPQLRLINVARGGIVNEEDLATAIRSGVIAGAALDVFDVEPATESPLFDLPQVIVTPHLGASTYEAQDRAGVIIAEQVNHALAGEFVPFAVNVSARGVSEPVRPFLPLAEQLGARFVRLVGGTPSSVELTFAGEIGGFDCRMAELAAIKGVVSQLVEGSVSYVNAEDLAEDLGLKFESVTTTTTPSAFVNSVTVAGDGHSLSGTVLLPSGDMRIISVDDITVDIAPADHLLVLANSDTPGMIGAIGSLLGDLDVNIDDMHIGRSSESGMALMAIATSEQIPPAAIDHIGRLEGIVSVRSLDLID